MTAVAPSSTSAMPAFCEGIQYFGESLPGFETYGAAPAIAEGKGAIADPRDRAAVYQTLLAADALRYLVLQITASKASGHPGGVCQLRRSLRRIIHAGPQKCDDRSWPPCPRFLQRHVSRSLPGGDGDPYRAATARSLPGTPRTAGPPFRPDSGTAQSRRTPGPGQHFAMAAACCTGINFSPAPLAMAVWGNPTS